MDTAYRSFKRRTVYGARLSEAFDLMRRFDHAQRPDGWTGIDNFVRGHPPLKIRKIIVGQMHPRLWTYFHTHTALVNTLRSQHIVISLGVGFGHAITSYRVPRSQFIHQRTYLHGAEPGIKADERGLAVPGDDKRPRFGQVTDPDNNLDQQK
jgi:hypothetical protein